MSAWLGYSAAIFALICALGATLALAIQALDGKGWPYGLASALLLSATIGLIGATWPDGGSGNVRSWPGGDGPDTVCWYAPKDNPDATVWSGKTPITVDGGSTMHTFCTIDSED